MHMRYGLLVILYFHLSFLAPFIVAVALDGFRGHDYPGLWFAVVILSLSIPSILFTNHFPTVWCVCARLEIVSLLGVSFIFPFPVVAL